MYTPSSLLQQEHHYPPQPSPQLGASASPACPLPPPPVSSSSALMGGRGGRLGSVSVDTLRLIDSFALPDAHAAFKLVNRRFNSAVASVPPPLWYRVARKEAAHWVSKLPPSIRLHPTFRVSSVSYALSASISVMSGSGIAAGGSNSSNSANGANCDGESFKLLVHLMCTNPTNDEDLLRPMTRPATGVSGAPAGRVGAPSPPSSMSSYEQYQYQLQQQASSSSAAALNPNGIVVSGGVPYTVAASTAQGLSMANFSVATPAQLATLHTYNPSSSRLGQQHLYPEMETYGKRERIVVNWGCTLPRGVVPNTAASAASDVVGSEFAHMSPEEAKAARRRRREEDEALAAKIAAATANFEGDQPLMPLPYANAAATNVSHLSIEWVHRWASSTHKPTDEVVRMFGVGMLIPNPTGAGGGGGGNSPKKGGGASAAAGGDACIPHFIVSFGVGGIGVDPSLSSARGITLGTVYESVPEGWGGPRTHRSVATYWHMDTSSAEASIQMLCPAHIDNAREAVLSSHPTVLQHMRVLERPYKAPVPMHSARPVGIGLRLEDSLLRALVAFGSGGMVGAAGHGGGGGVGGGVSSSSPHHSPAHQNQHQHHQQNHNMSTASASTSVRSGAAVLSLRRQQKAQQEEADRKRKRKAEKKRKQQQQQSSSSKSSNVISVPMMATLTVRGDGVAEITSTAMTTTSSVNSISTPGGGDRRLQYLSPPSTSLVMGASTSSSVGAGMAVIVGSGSGGGGGQPFYSTTTTGPMTVIAARGKHGGGEESLSSIENTNHSTTDDDEGDLNKSISPHSSRSASDDDDDDGDSSNDGEDDDDSEGDLDMDELYDGREKEDDQIPIPTDVSQLFMQSFLDPISESVKALEEHSYTHHVAQQNRKKRKRGVGALRGRVAAAAAASAGDDHPTDDPSAASSGYNNSHSATTHTGGDDDDEADDEGLIDIVTLQEVIIDLTTPKGVWRCSKGVGSVSIVPDPLGAWLKRKEQLQGWSRRYLERILKYLVVTGGFPANLMPRGPTTVDMQFH